MQKYWFRMRYSPGAFQGMVAAPRSRAPEIEKMLGGSGMELVDAGFSVSTGEICAVVRGTREQVGKVEFACMASGAFVEVDIIELVTLDDMVEMMSGAGQLLGKYQSPNMDEIDRMLLDE